MSSAARIEELQKKFDENPRRYFAPLANECRKAGDLDAAIAICRTHLPQQPGHMSGHIVYGQALFEAGELEEARSVFHTALALDPENLIALRHLGDIAAREGDLDEARRWYLRVLDTDPRNEEIQQVLAALPDGGDPGADYAPAGDALPTLIEPALVAAAAEAAAEPPPIDAQPEADAPDLDEFELHRELALPSAVEGGTAAAESSPAPSPAEEEAAAPRGAPPLVADSFTLVGFEATSFEEPRPATPPAEEWPGEGAAEAADASPDALPPHVPSDLVWDEGAQPIDPETTGFGATGLEPTGFGVPTPPSADAFVTETMAELYLQQGYRERALEVYRQLVAQSPGDAGLRERMARVEAEGAEVVTEDFATEPVPAADAHEAEGPSIAVDEPPADAALPTALDPALVAAAAEAAEDRGDAGSAAAPAGPADRVQRGPSIREFLAGLAGGSAPAVAPAAAVGVDLAPAPGGEVAEVIDAGAAAATDPSPAQARAGEAAPLDRLFGAAERQGQDVRAADALASAFAPEGTASAAGASVDPLSGQPARPAGDDLSLDQVFRQQRRGTTPPQPGGFSFDQFFAGDAPPPPPQEPHSGGGDAEDDVEQFNSWLKGLKNQ